MKAADDLSAKGLLLNLSFGIGHVICRALGIREPIFAEQVCRFLQPWCTNFINRQGRKVDPFRVPDSGTKNWTVFQALHITYIRGPENGHVLSTGIWDQNWVQFSAPKT